MKLDELNEHILNKYRELIDSHNITMEDIIKSSASMTISLFDSENVEEVEVDGKQLKLIQL